MLESKSPNFTIYPISLSIQTISNLDIYKMGKNVITLNCLHGLKEIRNCLLRKIGKLWKVRMFQQTCICGSI